MELAWEYDMNVLEPRSLCLFWCNDHLYVKSITVDEMELPTRGYDFFLISFKINENQ